MYVCIMLCENVIISPASIAVLMMHADMHMHLLVKLTSLLTLGAHAQRGLQLSFCLSVCLSVHILFSDYRLRDGL